MILLPWMGESREAFSVETEATVQSIAAMGTERADKTGEVEFARGANPYDDEIARSFRGRRRRETGKDVKVERGAEVELADGR